MKTIVDSLPYYGEFCPYAKSDFCTDKSSLNFCPRFWSKHFIASENNPHQCSYLIDLEQALSEMNTKN